MGVVVTTIRTMGLEDLEAVLAIEQAAQPRPWSEQVFRDELAADNRVYLVAEEGTDRSRSNRTVRVYHDSGGTNPHRTEVVGFGGVMVIGDEAHVTNLVVAENHRRHGIGRDLMVSLMEAAVAAGARHLTLEVREQNVAARALYSSLGLAPVGVRPRYFGDDDALILWAHDIDQPNNGEGPV